MENMGIVNILGPMIPHTDNAVCSIKPDDLKSSLAKLEKISSSSHPRFCHLLCSDARKELRNINIFLGAFCNDDVGKNWLTNKNNGALTLELLLVLHKKGLLLFTTYLFYHELEASRFAHELVEIIFTDFINPEENEISHEIFCCALSSLINVGPFALRKLFSLSSSCIDTFSLQFIKRIDEGGELKINFLESIVKDNNTIESQLKQFTVSLLNGFLLYEPLTQSIDNIVHNHWKSWSPSNISSHFKSVFNQIHSLLTPSLILDEIGRASTEEVNLKYILQAISLLVDESPANYDLIRAKTDEWLKEALNSKNNKQLITVILMARHNCSITSKYFAAYASWFGSLQIKSQANYSFLLKSLTGMVPHEPPIFLKIHVTKTPAAPSSCQSVLSEYMSLAKARLSELDEATECMGLFNDFHESFQEQLASDVSRVIAHYKETGRVAKAVLEAAVFRKQYYDKVFLPNLLSVPNSMDPIRGEVIKKLSSLGKIPSAVYRKWSRE